MQEIVVLVDEYDSPIGYEEKIKAHSNGGRLHRAFSIFVFNSKKQALLQLRSKEKHHFQNLWSNPCCSHPRKDEKLEDAAHRKLMQEFGFDIPLKEIFSFTYKAHDKQSGLTEHEYDHVFLGQYDGVPKPNPEEIDDWKWVSIDELKKDLQKNPEKFTPWSKIAFERLFKQLNNVLP
jgi:isopentenyl-diphosphate delta-isomerase